MVEFKIPNTLAASSYKRIEPRFLNKTLEFTFDCLPPYLAEPFIPDHLKVYGSWNGIRIVDLVKADQWILRGSKQRTSCWCVHRYYDCDGYDDKGYIAELYRARRNARTLKWKIDVLQSLVTWQGDCGNDVHFGDKCEELGVMATFESEEDWIEFCDYTLMVFKVSLPPFPKNAKKVAS